MKKIFYVILFILILSVFTGCKPVASDTDIEGDTDVTNYSSYNTDIIYQIVVDRFFNGDYENDPASPLLNLKSNRFYHGGDWAGIVEKITDGYLTDLGITAIWITSPIENIDILAPADASEAWTSAAYHGYWGKDYYRHNPNFGTLEDFKELVSVAHDNNIKVIIDFAPNHTSTASGYAYPVDSNKYPLDGGLYKDGILVGNLHNDDENNYFNHEGGISDWNSSENMIYGSLSGLADLNQMNPVIDEYMKESINKWLDMGIDGIRVDAVKHMSAGWMKNWSSSVYEHKPVFIFGEWMKDDDIKPSNDMVNFANNSGMNLLDFPLSVALRKGLGDGSGNMISINSAVTDSKRAYNSPLSQVTFIDNHDIARFQTVGKNNNDRTEMALALQMALPGIPCIYYGTEQYMTGAEDPDNRADMVSFNKDSDAFKTVSAMSSLRRSNRSISYGDYQMKYVDGDVLVFERTFGGDSVLVTVNKSIYDFFAQDIATNLAGGKYEDYFDELHNGTDMTAESDGSISQIKIPANSISVYVSDDESDSELLIGDVSPMSGIAGNTVTITGINFGSDTGKVYFGSEEAEIVSWKNNIIKVLIPEIPGNKYMISVRKGESISNEIKNFTINTASLIPIRMIINNVNTTNTQKVYIVGDVIELGLNNNNFAVGPYFSGIKTIASRPNWFIDLSLPAGTEIKYKIILKDNLGVITYESETYRTIIPDIKNNIVTLVWQNY